MYIPTCVHAYLAFAVFRGLHRASNPVPDPSDPLDTVPDLCDERDFEIPDHDTRSLLNKLLSKLSKSVDDEYRTLSDLLATNPDPSGFALASALTVTDARESPRLIVQYWRLYQHWG